MMRFLKAGRRRVTKRRIVSLVLLFCFPVVVIVGVLLGVSDFDLLNRGSGAMSPRTARMVSKDRVVTPLSSSAVTAILERDIEASEESAIELISLEVAPIEIDPNRAAILLNVSLLEKGYSRLEKVNDYTATFYKQERIRGKLSEEDVTEIKIRHSPFSVYMKWLVNKAGQELLFVQGRNSGNLLVRQVGWKARLLPELNLDPSGPIAMSDSRHPVTEAGLLKLMKTLIADRLRDIAENCAVTCQVYEEESCFDRDCYRFVIEYRDPKTSAVYRKSEQYIDKELLLPVGIANYTWPEQPQAGWSLDELDEATLIEFYGYSDIKIDAELADLDFDRTNADYGFSQ